MNGNISSGISGEKSRFYPEIAFGRRPSVSRSRVNYSQLRRKSAERYKKGIEAASVFELQRGQREAEPVAAPINTVKPFYVKYKRALIAACLLIVAAIGGIWGAGKLKELYTSNETFISDVTMTGNITIADRLTSSEEMSEKVTYVLVIGVDAEGFNTDCLWLVCYDIEGNMVNVMQIPRDTYIGNGRKINSVYGYPETVRWCEACSYSPPSDERSSGKHTVCGTELTKKRESNVSAIIRFINEHLGMPIDHFVVFNFEGFEKVVDAMGGITITLEKGIHDCEITLDAGTHHLDGETAVHYMRHRKSYAEGDIGRVNGQRIFINAMLKKALEMDVSQMIGLVTQCMEYFETDLSLQEIKNYALKARNLSTERLNMFTMPGEDHWAEPRELNPSYYDCFESKTAEVLNTYMLPYGLPDGTYLEPGDISFPEIVDIKPPETTTAKPSKTTTTASETTTTKKTSTTTESTQSTTTTTKTTEKTTTTTTKSTTEPTSTTTTTKKTTTTESKTTTTTTKETTTKATTTAKPTEATKFDEGAASGSSAQQLSPLSDPRK